VRPSARLIHGAFRFGLPQQQAGKHVSNTTRISYQSCGMKNYHRITTTKIIENMIHQLIKSIAKSPLRLCGEKLGPSGGNYGFTFGQTIFARTWLDSNHLDANIKLIVEDHFNDTYDEWFRYPPADSSPFDFISIFMLSSDLDPCQMDHRSIVSAPRRRRGTILRDS